MKSFSASFPYNSNALLPSWRLAVLTVLLVFAACSAAFAQISVSPDQNTVVVDDAPEMEVFAYGKTVIVRQRAKGVLAFGGDVVIEGSVEGDVAAIGGSVIQKENAYIGGDVIILGGKYKPESQAPLREKGKETVMYAGYQEELHDLTQNPSSLFSPAFSAGFVAQRILSVLFWFLVTLGLTTLAPGAVSRAAARLQLSALKVAGIGMAAFLLTTVGVIVSLRFLPNHVSVLLGLMAFAMVLLAYLFGRVVLHVIFGKLILKYLLPEKARSEMIAILCGVLFSTLILSVPYVWTLALIAMFAVGIGLVLTGRTTKSWRTP